MTPISTHSIGWASAWFTKNIHFILGVRLSEGKLSGLANMARWGDATLETKYDENVSSIIDLINNIENLNLIFLQNHDMSSHIFWGSCSCLLYTLDMSGHPIDWCSHRPDRVVLSFTLAVKDLHASYIWRRRSIRGEVVQLLSLCCWQGDECHCNPSQRS